MDGPSAFDGRKMPRSREVKRSRRMNVSLSREEADLIFGAAWGARMSGSAWARRAMLRVVLLQGLPQEIEAAVVASGGGVGTPRVKRRGL